MRENPVTESFHEALERHAVAGDSKIRPLVDLVGRLRQLRRGETAAPRNLSRIMRALGDDGAPSGARSSD